MAAIALGARNDAGVHFAGPAPLFASAVRAGFVGPAPVHEAVSKPAAAAIDSAVGRIAVGRAVAVVGG